MAFHPSNLGTYPGFGYVPLPLIPYLCPLTSDSVHECLLFHNHTSIHVRMVSADIIKRSGIIKCKFKSRARSHVPAVKATAGSSVRDVVLVDPGHSSSF